MVKRGFAFAVGLSAALLATALYANHSWGGYHWARTNNPFTLKVGDNVDSSWDMYLNAAVADWNASSVMNLNRVQGLMRTRNCRGTEGRIEVCNASYGQNGWLGIAQIWTNGSHIAQAVTKVNDTYFTMPRYDTPAWRSMVMCQEMGHDFGLDHQDETFDNANLGTCMDYTNDPDGGPGGASSNDPSNEHPNSHDYAQLESIYRHLDSSTTIAAAPGSAAFDAASRQLERGQFGRLIRSTNGGRTELFELDLGGGRKVFTHVIWAD